MNVVLINESLIRLDSEIISESEKEIKIRLTAREGQTPVHVFQQLDIIRRRADDISKAIECLRETLK